MNHPKITIYVRIDRDLAGHNSDGRSEAGLFLFVFCSVGTDIPSMNHPNINIMDRELLRQNGEERSEASGSLMHMGGQ